MASETLKTINDYWNIVSSNNAVCFYLSTSECNVCKVLKPKVIDMIDNDFPQIQFYYVNLNEAKEVSGQLSVFSVPTILIYFEGKETIRVSRNIHLEELRKQIDRYYQMIFNN